MAVIVGLKLPGQWTNGFWAAFLWHQKGSLLQPRGFPQLPNQCNPAVRGHRVSRPIMLSVLVGLRCKGCCTCASRSTKRGSKAFSAAFKTSPPTCSIRHISTPATGRPALSQSFCCCDSMTQREVTCQAQQAAGHACIGRRDVDRHPQVCPASKLQPRRVVKHICAKSKEGRPQPRRAVAKGGQCQHTLL